MATNFIKSFLIYSTALIANAHYNHNTNRKTATQDPCKLLPDRRICNPDVSVRRFYFDSESLQCRPFQYKGCPDSNTNNFVAQWDCLRSCLLKQGYRDALSKLVYGPSSVKKDIGSTANYPSNGQRSHDTRHQRKEDYRVTDGYRKKPRIYGYNRKNDKFNPESGTDNGYTPPKSKSQTYERPFKFGTKSSDSDRKFSQSVYKKPSVSFTPKSAGYTDSYDSYRIPADLSFSSKSYNGFDTGDQKFSSYSDDNDDDEDRFLSTYEEAKKMAKSIKRKHDMGYDSFDESSSYDPSDEYRDHYEDSKTTKQTSYSDTPAYAPTASDWELRKNFPSIDVGGFHVSPKGTSMPPVYHPPSAGTPVNFMTSFNMQRPHHLPKGYNGRNAVIKTPDSVLRIKGGGRGRPLMFERHGKNSYAWYKEGEKKRKDRKERYDPPPIKPPPVHVPSNGDPPSGPGWFVEEIPGGYRAIKDDTKENGWKHTYTRIFLEHPSGLAGTSFWSMESEYDPTKGQGDEMENEIIREQRKIQKLEFERSPEENSNVVLSDLNNHFLKPIIPHISVLSNMTNNNMTSTYTSQIQVNTTKVTQSDNKTHSVLMSAYISQSSVLMNVPQTLTPTHPTAAQTQNKAFMDPSKHQTPPSKHAPHPVMPPNNLNSLLTPKVSVAPESTDVSRVVADPGQINNYTLTGILRDKLTEETLPSINTTDVFTSLDLDGGSGDADETLDDMTTPAYVAYTANFDEQSTTPKKDSVDMVFDNLVPFTTPVYNSKGGKRVDKMTTPKQRIATKKLTPQDAQRIEPPPLAFEAKRQTSKPQKFKIVAKGFSLPNMGEGEPEMTNIHAGFGTPPPEEFNYGPPKQKMQSHDEKLRSSSRAPRLEFTKPPNYDRLELRPEMTSSVLFADENQEIMKETPSEFVRAPEYKPQWLPVQRNEEVNLPPLQPHEPKIHIHRPPGAHAPPRSREYDSMNEAEMLIENALGPRQENPDEPHFHRPRRPPTMPRPAQQPGQVVEERQSPPLMMNKPLIRTELPEKEHLHVAGPQTFPPSCYQQVNPGPCRAMIRRWYYNSQHGRCMIFYYGGCEGNANSFNSEEQCMNVCGGLAFSPIDSPLPERRNSMEPAARRFSYSPMSSKPETFDHSEERQQERFEPRQEQQIPQERFEPRQEPEIPQERFEPRQEPEIPQERFEPRHEPEIPQRPEMSESIEQPRKPLSENFNAAESEFFNARGNQRRPEPRRQEEERRPEQDENEDKRVIEKVEKEERPVKQMWPSFMQLLHRGLYMSAWKMQHRPTPTPTQPDTRDNTEGGAFYITTTEAPLEGVTDVKFTDKDTPVTDNHNVAPTRSTLPSKEIPTTEPKSEDNLLMEELSSTEKDEESNTTEEVEEEEPSKEEGQEGQEEEEEDQDEGNELPGPVQPKKGKKNKKNKKMKMRIKMVLPFMRIFLNKYQQKPRERLLSNLISGERPTMMPWGIRRVEEQSSPWRMMMERTRPRAPQGKNGLTVMQVFLHKTNEEQRPWWARRRRPQPSYYHRDMLPLSHSYAPPHQEIHSQYSTIIYRPNRQQYMHRPQQYYPQPAAPPVVPFNPIRVILRPRPLPPAGEPNMACLLPLDIGMCQGQRPQTSGFRYYYNQEQRSCAVFFHFGCRTNANNFATMQECADVCRVTTPKPTEEATTVAATVTSIPEVNTEEPKMIEDNSPVAEQDLSGETISPSEVEEVEKQDVSRARVRFASEEEYATIIAILALGAAALLVLIILCSMHIFRRVKKSRTMKKGSIVEAVLRAHIFGELPGLPYGNKDMKKPDTIVPELPKPPQSTV